MPDHRQHRGQHPLDNRLFSPKVLPRLREAVADFSWLLGRGYAAKSGLELIGNRYQLAERQRLAVLRCACSDEKLARRRQHEVALSQVALQAVHIDGYNLLTTIEAALSGGLILAARDGCYRDLASMHGTFRRVEETVPAIRIIGAELAALAVQETVWLLDSPVSNSGRLKGILLQEAQEQSWNWRVEVVMNPDPLLAASNSIVISADSVILDQCEQWCNLARHIITHTISDAHIVDLAG